MESTLKQMSEALKADYSPAVMGALVARAPFHQSEASLRPIPWRRRLWYWLQMRTRPARRTLILWLAGSDIDSD